MLELADAVVIGGGVLGLGLAEALSRRLSRVLLVEAARCGGRATSGGFAWVNASSKWQDETYHRVNAEACRMHLALAAEHDAARTGWNGGGSLKWVRQSNREGAETLDRCIEALQRWDYPVARLSRGEMQALEPYVRFDDDAIGMFAPSEGWISAPRLMRFYGEQARERHAEITEFTQATGFSLDHRGGVASVETSAGRVSTRIAVLCAGTETWALAGLLTSKPLRSSEPLVKGAPGLLVEAESLPAEARLHRVCYPVSESGFHLRPTPDGGLLMGADDTDAALTGGRSAPGMAAITADDAQTSGTALLMECAAAVLPNFDRGTPASARTCIRPMPSDGLPLVGELPGVTGAYLLASHSAVTLGPLLSQLLADEIITGRISPWLAPYRPARLFR